MSPGVRDIGYDGDFRQGRQFFQLHHPKTLTHSEQTKDKEALIQIGLLKCSEILKTHSIVNGQHTVIQT